MLLPLLLSPGKPVAQMVAAFRERRDYVVQRLQQIPGVKLAEPQVWMLLQLLQRTVVS
jgi:aspartate/methionine/tyrosine aminotransferase